MSVQGFRYTAVSVRGRRIQNFLWLPGWLPGPLADGLGRFLLTRAYRKLETFQADPLLGLKVNPDQVAIFARQLATMVRAGVPLHQSVQFLADGENEQMTRASEILATQLATGHSFSSSLARLPGVFPPVFQGFARVGESSGRLVQSLENLAQQLERLVWVKRRLKGGIAYPSFLALGALILSGILVFGIVPMMAPTLAELNVELPALTRWLLWITEWGSHPLLVISVGLTMSFFIALVVFLFGETGRYTHARFQCDFWLLQVPVVGNLCRRYASARILSATHVCVDTGISVNKALQDASSMAGNTVIEDGVLKTVRAMNDGLSLGEALEEYRVLSRSETQLLICAFESGDLSGALKMLAKMAEEEVETAIDTFSALMEPVILAVMSLVVGVVSLATFLPWIKLIQTLG